MTQLKFLPMLAIVGLMAGLILPANSFAVMEDMEQKSLKGNVVEAAEDILTVNQKVPVLKDKKIDFLVNPETQLQGIASIEDLNAGDEVMVEYVEDHGQKVASIIIKLVPHENADSGV